MKKLFTILMAVLMVLSISACSNGSGGSEKPAEETTGTKTIGVVQLHLMRRPRALSMK